MKRWLATLLLPSVCGALLATTVRPVSIENMAGRSSLVAEGRAISSWSQWNASHTLIVTYTRFQVSRVLKGAAAREVTIRQPGGSAGVYRDVVHGVRYLRPGQEAALFLKESGDGDGSMTVVGLMQGMFRIEREASGAAFVSNSTSGVEVKGDGGAVTSFQGARIPLSEFEARVARGIK
ncbi:MAG: hypothetical protein L0Z53_13125 [Acidobacteriales bacterium]|nr:hypothetical protein [Terriglobales bacterium]